MKLFSKEDLKGMLYGDIDLDVYDVISNDIDIVDTFRWSIIHEMIFTTVKDGKFYRTTYSVGATECQDESPYEYAPDMIECEEVIPKEITTTIYVAVGE